MSDNPITPPDSGDMSWFLIAVGNGSVVILDYSEGWSEFGIEFHWEDTFTEDAPLGLAPGAYRWVDYTIGFWSEDDLLNVSGGRFEPYLPPAPGESA